MAHCSYYDVIVIGSGAGGGTLAHALADTGKRILILERGTWLPREKENWDAHEVFVKQRYHTTELWVRPQREIFSARHQLLGRRKHEAVRRGAAPLP